MSYIYNFSPCTTRPTSPMRTQNHESVSYRKRKKSLSIIIRQQPRTRSYPMPLLLKMTRSRRAMCCTQVKAKVPGAMELVSESLLFFMKRTLILCLVKEDIGMIWELGVGKVALWKKDKEKYKKKSSSFKNQIKLIIF